MESQALRATHSPIQEYLNPGERLLWTGMPDPGALFTTSDLFLVPFSLLWAGFSVFWEANAIASGDSFFYLWGIPFLAAGAYITVGRFVYKRLSNSNTYYGVTNERVLVLNSFRSRKLRSAFLSTLPVLSISGSSKRGTIQLSQPAPWASWYANTGWGVGADNNVLAFYDIPEPRRVYDLIYRERAAAQRTSAI